MKLPPGIIDVKAYKQIKNFCNADNEFVYNEVDSGYAYLHKPTKKTVCLELVDLHRGRGFPKECRKKECKYYIYVNPSQNLLDQFIEEERLEDE